MYKLNIESVQQKYAIVVRTASNNIFHSPRSSHNTQHRSRDTVVRPVKDDDTTSVSSIVVVELLIFNSGHAQTNRSI